MSIELLERAAKKLREAAEAATPGPWEHVDYSGSHSDADVTYMGCGSVITMGNGIEGGDIAAPSGDLYPRSGYSPYEDMAYIALMHPPVALAIADWLEFVAGARRDYRFFEVGHTDYAMKLARAILRDSGNHS